MIIVDHFDDHGFSQRRSAGHIYAEALADFANYSQAGETFWLGATVKDALFESQVHGSPVRAFYAEPRRLLALYLMDTETPGGITVIMRGEAWPEERFEALVNRLKILPHGHLVAQALIAKADWMDDHPEFRGLKLAQIKSRRYAPAQTDTPSERKDSRRNKEPHPDQLELAP